MGGWNGCQRGAGEKRPIVGGAAQPKLDMIETAALIAADQQGI
jgi:hypothetical protein